MVHRLGEFANLIVCNLYEEKNETIHTEIEIISFLEPTWISWQAKIFQKING